MLPENRFTAKDLHKRKCRGGAGLGSANGERSIVVVIVHVVHYVYSVQVFDLVA